MIRDSSDEACELNYTEHLFSRNKEIEISRFELFYSFIIFFYITHEKITIDGFYTILYLLKYFKVQCDNKLRDVLKNIFVSLSRSNDITNHDVTKILFDFSKKEIFSHEFFKKIAEEFFNLFIPDIDYVSSLYLKEQDVLLQEKYYPLYTDNRSENILILLLNTFDLKYLHIQELEYKNLKTLYFFLKNLKKPIDEIIFYKIPIQDQLIISLNTNSNFASLKRMVFLESMKETNMKFSYNLLAVNEIIFYDQFYIYQEDKIVESLILKELNNIKDTIIYSKNEKK
ncbi:hypothetical protein CWI38_0891p0020 [Hamiltosporidium tvaerminnensis]|uniref:Uncharacterized protein n=1 Tax=Hamiltosporidium tvaerminnensis TaxID=1176355 RepID=A0A4Q9LUT9_9MICR|nr:hypothetical protein CWI38_0891p0020 [Hamiltosporidium tvaerminnensis]